MSAAATLSPEEVARRDADLAISRLRGSVRNLDDIATRLEWIAAYTDDLTTRCWVGLLLLEVWQLMDRNTASGVAAMVAVGTTPSVKPMGNRSKHRAWVIPR